MNKICQGEKAENRATLRAAPAFPFALLRPFFIFPISDFPFFP